MSSHNSKTLLLSHRRRVLILSEDGSIACMIPVLGLYRDGDDTVPKWYLSLQTERIERIERTSLKTTLPLSVDPCDFPPMAPMNAVISLYLSTYTHDSRKSKGGSTKAAPLRPRLAQPPRLAIST